MNTEIKIPTELYKQLSTEAESVGLPTEIYIVEKLQPNLTEEQAIKRLDDFLEPRINSAKQGNFVDKTATEIMNEAVQKRLSEKCQNTN